MTEADLIVRETRPEWWAVKCRHCGAWLTKFDFTREEAVAIALGTLHTCPVERDLRLFA